MDDFVNIIYHFAFLYPLFMAYLWMVGAIYYRFHWEIRDISDVENKPMLSEYPGITFIVPCHNESENIRETIDLLRQQDYPEFEIITVNDASTDNTGEILDDIAKQDVRIRVIHLSSNQGKATGLRLAAMVSRYEYLICIDGDALLDVNAASWMIRHFTHHPRIGAVTGNPRIRTRSTLLGKIQVGEYSAIIGLIKRAQRIYGRVFTISGVVAAYRKSALHRVGYWASDMITEDIDISWRLQLDHWDILYEPNALCWILMPETFRGLWRQRLRWSQGGAEVFMRYFSALLSWQKRRMWLVFLEFLISIIWAYSIVTILVLWFAGQFFELPESIVIPTLVPGWTGVMLGITALLQFGVSIGIDSRYESRLGRYYYWMIWYPMAFWVIQVMTTVVAVPKAALRKPGRCAVWNSPDRGIRPQPKTEPVK